MNPSDEETSDSSSSSCSSIASPAERSCPTTPRRASNEDSRGDWSSAEHARSVSISPSHSRSAGIGDNSQLGGFGLRERSYTGCVTQKNDKAAYVDVGRRRSGEVPAFAYFGEGKSGGGGGGGGNGENGSTPVHNYRRSKEEIEDRPIGTATQELEYSQTQTSHLSSPTDRGQDAAVESPRNASSLQRPLSAPPNRNPYGRHSGLSQEKSAMSGSGARAGVQSSREYNVRYSDDGALAGRRAAKGRPGSESETAQVQARSRLSSTADSSPERRRSYQTQYNGHGKRSPRRKRSDESAFEGGESCEEGKELPLSSEAFGLHRWKEYAVLRHGGTRRFFNSKHGQDILLETAAAIRADEIDNLTTELKETRALAEELHGALRAEQAAKATLQSRLVSLERELEEMDYARRRWQRDDANYRDRGSNLERRLAGNTGNLRMFLFGASSKTEPVPPLASTLPCNSSCRPFVARGRSALASSRKPSVTGPACRVSVVSSTEEEEEGGGTKGAKGASKVEGDVVRRVREAAELERSELRRRHDVEMSTKQARIDKMKLEIRKLEAERDGLKQAAKGQAGMFSDGHAELKACLEEIKVLRSQSSELADTAKLDPAAARDARASSGDAAVAAPDHASAGSGGGVAGGGGGGGGASEPSDDARAWKKTMLATEEGLNHQVRTLQGLLLEAVAAAVPTISMPVAVTVAADSIRQGMGLPPLKHAHESHYHSAGRSTSLPITSVVGGSVVFRDGKLELEGYEPRQMNGKRFAGHENGLYQNGAKARARDEHHNHPSARAEDVGVQRSERTIDAAVLAEQFVVREAGMATTDRETKGHGSSTESAEAEKAERRAYGFSRRRFPDSGDEGSITASEGSGTRFPPVMPTDDDSEEDQLYAELPYHLPCDVIGRSRGGEGKEAAPEHRESSVGEREHINVERVSTVARATGTSTHGPAADGRPFPYGHTTHAKTKPPLHAAHETLSDNRSRAQTERDNKHRIMLAEMVETATTIPVAGVSMATVRQAPLLKAGER